jgi:lysophospholipase L1-like esterase
MNKKACITICITLSAVVLIGITLFAIYYFIMNPLPPRPKDGVIRVACIGDSITQGFGIKNAKRNSYPAQLQNFLGNEYQVLNYGLNRRCLLKDAKKPNRPYTKEKFYRLSQEAHPNTILIMIGTNDTKPVNWNASNFEKELEDFVKVYQNLESATEIYLLKSPPVFETKLTHDNNVLVDQLFPIIEKVAKKTNVKTIDIYSTLVNKPELFVDGLHPNAEGAGIIAKTVYSALKK